MDDQGIGIVPRRHETVSGKSGRAFLRAGDAPLPEGVAAGDEGAFVIMGEDVEAAKNVAY